MNLATSDSWITTDRGTLFARSWKPLDVSTHQDETILLFHDSLGCVDLWRDFPGKLAACTRRPVVAYDRLGFGRSDACDGPLPPTFIRDEAVHIVPCLLDALRLTRIIPFGHSVGGAMAVAAAAHLPAACAALITESAQSFVEDHTLAGVRAGQIEFEQPHRFERLAQYHGTKARWVLDAWIKTWLAPSFANWSLDDELEGVSCPTLAIHGDRDEYGSLEHPARIARLTSGPSRVAVLEECGHFPHRQHPMRVLRDVTQFLAQYDVVHQSQRIDGAKQNRNAKMEQPLKTNLLRFNGAVQRDPAIHAWMKRHPGELGAIAHQWFQVMRKCGDEVRELLHDGCPVACLGDAPFGYVNVFTAHVNVGFYHGAALPDPTRLLQGTGKFMRHVKLRPGTPTDAASLRTLIEVAYSDIKARVENG